MAALRVGSTAFGTIRRALSTQTLLRTAGQATTSTTPRPYEDIPELPFGWTPFAGSLATMPPHGLARGAENIKKIQKKYDRNNLGMVRATSPAINSARGSRILLIFDPDLVEEHFR